MEFSGNHPHFSWVKYPRLGHSYPLIKATLASPPTKYTHTFEVLPLNFTFHTVKFDSRAPITPLLPHADSFTHISATPSNPFERPWFRVIPCMFHMHQTANLFHIGKPTTLILPTSHRFRMCVFSAVILISERKLCKMM